MIRTYTKEYGLPEIRVLPSGEKQKIFNSVTMVYRSTRYDADHEDRFINAGLYRDTREVVELEFSPKLLNTGYVIPKIKRRKQEDGEKTRTTSKKNMESSSRKRKHSCSREADEVKTEERKKAKKRTLVQGYPSASATTFPKDKHSKMAQTSSQSSSLKSQKRKSLSRPSTSGRKFSKLDK